MPPTTAAVITTLGRAAASARFDAALLPQVVLSCKHEHACPASSSFRTTCLPRKPALP
jgi:hypothetical protein